MGHEKDPAEDFSAVLEPSQTAGTARKRLGTAPAAGTAGSCSRSTSPADTSVSADTYMSDEQMDSIIEKLPHWVDQLGGIRNLVIGGWVGLLMVWALCSTAAAWELHTKQTRQKTRFSILFTCQRPSTWYTTAKIRLGGSSVGNCMFAQVSKQQTDSQHAAAVSTQLTRTS